MFTLYYLINFDMFDIWQDNGWPNLAQKTCTKTLQFI